VKREVGVKVYPGAEDHGHVVFFMEDIDQRLSQTQTLHRIHDPMTRGTLMSFSGVCSVQQVILKMIHVLLLLKIKLLHKRSFLNFHHLIIFIILNF